MYKFDTFWSPFGAVCLYDELQSRKGEMAFKRWRNLLVLQVVDEHNDVQTIAGEERQVNIDNTGFSYISQSS